MSATTALRIVEGSSMDKSKALSAALSQIERQFGKGSVMKLLVERDFIACLHLCCEVVKLGQKSNEATANFKTGHRGSKQASTPRCWPLYAVQHGKRDQWP